VEASAPPAAAAPAGAGAAPAGAGAAPAGAGVAPAAPPAINPSAAAPEPSPSSPGVAGRATAAPAPPPSAPPAQPAPAREADFVRVARLADGTDVRLGGIAWSETAPLAYVNGRLAGVGESVSGCAVRAIERESVRLTCGGAALRIRLR